MASLNRRFARLRSTAIPTDLPAVIPICKLSVVGSTTNTTSGWA
jgi:hypothetical protein